MYAVLHVKAVLNHVSIGPDGLVLVTWQLQVLGSDNLGNPDVVVASLPRRTVAGSTANLHKDLLATLHVGILQVTGTGNCESTVPHLEGPEVVVRHLGREVVPLVVKLVGAGVQQVEHGIGNSLISTVGIVG